MRYESRALDAIYALCVHTHKSDDEKDEAVEAAAAAAEEEEEEEDDEEDDVMDAIASRWKLERNKIQNGLLF